MVQKAEETDRANNVLSLRPVRTRHSTAVILLMRTESEQLGNGCAVRSIGQGKCSATTMAAIAIVWDC